MALAPGMGRHIGCFNYSLAAPVLLFVITTLLFARIDAPERFDAAAFFARSVPGLYTAYALFFVILVMNSLIFNEVSFVHVKTVFKLGAAALAASGLVWCSHRYQDGLPSRWDCSCCCS